MVRFPMVAMVLLFMSMLTVKVVLSQGGFNLEDNLGGNYPLTTPPVKQRAGGAGEDFDLSDGLATKPPFKVPHRTTKAPFKLQPKPENNGFDLSDGLDPNNDIPAKDKNKGQGGGLSDNDLFDIAKDETFKPDKGKGERPGSGSGQRDQSDDYNDTIAETGTIAGIASAVFMALVGAVSSYISYQKKKLCFSIQQSLNAEMTKSEIPESTVVATEPQVQQTLLEPPNEENPV